MSATMVGNRKWFNQHLRIFIKIINSCLVVGVFQRLDACSLYSPLCQVDTSRTETWAKRAAGASWVFLLLLVDLWTSSSGDQLGTSWVGTSCLDDFSKYRSFVPALPVLLLVLPDIFLRNVWASSPNIVRWAELSEIGCSCPSFGQRKRFVILMKLQTIFNGTSCRVCCRQCLNGVIWCTIDWFFLSDMICMLLGISEVGMLPQLFGRSAAEALVISLQHSERLDFNTGWLKGART